MSDKTRDAINIVNAVKDASPMTITDIFSNTNKVASLAKNLFNNKIDQLSDDTTKTTSRSALNAFIALIGWVFSFIIYIIIYVIALCFYIIQFVFNIFFNFSKFFGDYEFFYDFDEDSNYAYFIFMDILKERVEKDESDKIDNNTPGNIHYDINEIHNDIIRKLQNKLEKYNTLIRDLKIQKDKEDEERISNEKLQAKLNNNTSNTYANIKSEEIKTLWNTATTSVPNTIYKYLTLIFLCLKLFLELVFSAAKYIVSGFFLILKFSSHSFLNVFQQSALKWSRPFAGLMILVMIILVMVLVTYNMYAPEEELYNSSFANIGGGSFDYTSMFNDNSSFFEALNRLPLEFYSFVNDFRFFYQELLKRLKFFMNFSSEIIDDATNFAREPEDYERTKNTTDNIYDNIYTFNAHYISTIINKLPPDTAIDELKKIINLPTLEKNNYVVHLIKPKNIKETVNKSTELKLDLTINNSKDDYSWKIKCEDSKFFNDVCMIKDITISDNKTLNTCGIIDTKTNNDYNNI
jgi:hypothetical protein